jgi:hypothetical protein
MTDEIENPARQLRDQIGLWGFTAMQLGKESEVHPAIIQRYLAGHHQITPAQLEAMNAAVDRLIAVTDPLDPPNSTA